MEIKYGSDELAIIIFLLAKMTLLVPVLQTVQTFAVLAVVVVDSVQPRLALPTEVPLVILNNSVGGPLLGDHAGVGVFVPVMFVTELRGKGGT